MTAGYSTRSLADKLGLKADVPALLINASDSLLREIPAAVQSKVASVIPKPSKKLFGYIHVFTTQRASLEQSLPLIKAQLEQDGMIWISWPKLTAKKIALIDSDLNEDVVRELAILNGLVDVKVCAIDEIWSGLKLVIPLKSRRRS